MYFRFISLGEQFLKSRWAVYLTPLSWVWRFVTYVKSFRSVERVSACVVSVGNISLGGTGKTPFVIRLANEFKNYKIAIVSRGYGGDEMKVIARHAPHVRCYEDKDRVEAAKRAVVEGAKLILLDDGFQYRRLYRDLDIVLLRPQDLSDRVMPAGRLREPIEALQRADLVFSKLESKVRRVITLQGAEVSIQGCRVGIFCGIAHPERFKKTVESLGAQIIFEHILADHEPMDLKNLKSFSVKYLVCTEKDAVKLPPTDLPIVVIEIETDPSKELILWQNTVAKIAQKLNN